MKEIIEYNNIPCVILAICPFNQKFVSAFYNSDIICLYNDNDVYRKIELWWGWEGEHILGRGSISFTDTYEKIHVFNLNDVIHWIQENIPSENMRDLNFDDI